MQSEFYPLEWRCAYDWNASLVKTVSQLAVIQLLTRMFLQKKHYNNSTELRLSLQIVAELIKADRG